MQYVILNDINYLFNDVILIYYSVSFYSIAFITNRDFVLIWMKQTRIWFNLQRDRTRNGLPNIKETLAESLQLQMSVLHQHMKIFQSTSLVSQAHIHMMARQNVKKKNLICQIPITLLKQHANTNSGLHNLKIYSSKGCRKTSQR